MPSFSRVNFSSSLVSARWVWSRTPRLRASLALSRSRSPDTEKGEQGARATRCMAYRESSCQTFTSRSESARMASMGWTTLSGGRPPSFLDRSMEPREAWNRMPRVSAARNWAAIRSPARSGNT